MSNTLKRTISTINILLITINLTLAQPAVWSTSGNNLQGPFSDAFLGTTNNTPLIFKTNGIEIMRLTEYGDLDFAPGTQLNLMGTANLDTIVSKYINTNSLYAAYASINNLHADNGTITNLQSSVITSSVVTSDTINASHLNVTTIENINVINTDILTADEGTITQLETTNLTTQNLKATGLGGSGTELVKVQNDGTFERFPLSNNTEDVLTGAGTFRLAPWTLSGNDITSTYSGNVGLGIINATEKLEVIGNTKISGTLFANDINITQSLNTDNLTVTGTLNTNSIVSNNIDVNTIHVTNQLKIGNSIIFPAGTNKMYTDATFPTTLFIQSEPAFNNNTIINSGNSGRVGIGTSSPLGKLHVVTGGSVSYGIVVADNTSSSGTAGIRGDGLIFCREILIPGSGGANLRIQSNGIIQCRKVEVMAGFIADYVFEKDYNLMPLDQLEDYIKENKHLPNIPSESEVKANNNSYDLGNMTESLLAKVEELTLYTIEINKKLELLQKENEILKLKNLKFE